VAERLAGAREECLAELLGDWWTPDRPADLTDLVHELSAETGGSEAECPRGSGGDGAARRAAGRA
jgi:hypothetical protein